MGTSAAERIALEIESTADLAAVKQTREELKTTASETGKLTATVEQSRAAWAAAGGDMNKFAGELAKLVAGEKAAQSSVSGTNTALKDIPPSVKPADESVKRLTDSTRAMTLAQIAAIDMDKKMEASKRGSAQATATLANETVNLSPKVRSASNAVATLSVAAATGGGSLQGMAIAAGGLATNMLAVSKNAQLAASASGIGAIVTLLGVLVPLLMRANDETERMDSSFRDFGSLGVEALKGIEAAKRAEQAALIQRMEAYDAQGVAGKTVTDPLGRERSSLLKRNESLNAELLAVTNARIAAEAEASRRASKDRDQQAERDQKTATTLQEQLVTSYQDLNDRRTLSESAAARQRVEREFNASRAVIEGLAVDEATKTRLTLEAATLRTARLKEIEAKASADRLAMWQSEVAARQAQLTTVDKLQRQMYANTLAGIHQVVIGQESLKSAMTKAMLAPLVTYLEGKAVQHSLEALADLAFFNFAGAAKHAAVAAAALAGARKVAQIGGLTVGGGGTASVGSGGGAAFTPRSNPDDRNPTVINLITQNPYSGEAMGIVQYELNRGGVLKRPVNLPPTTGLHHAGAR